MKENKHQEFDKAISEEIMREFRGKVIDTICGDCYGKGKYSHGDKCQNCKGEGHYKVQY